MDPRLPRIFLVQSWLVMVGWALLIAAPFWRPASTAVWAIICVICATYAYLIVFGSRYDQGERPPSFKSFLTLSGVMRLFKSPRVALTGWIHFLAFDLLVGLLIVSDSQEQGISHWIVLPILLFTLMIGPSGLLLYVALRLLYTGGFPDLSFGDVG